MDRRGASTSIRPNVDGRHGYVHEKMARSAGTNDRPRLVRLKVHVFNRPRAWVRYYFACRQRHTPSAKRSMFPSSRHRPCGTPASVSSTVCPSTWLSMLLSLRYLWTLNVAESRRVPVSTNGSLRPPLALTVGFRVGRRAPRDDAVLHQPHLGGTAGQICCPRIHQVTATLEQVRTELGSSCAADHVSERRFRDLPWLARLRAPVAERAAETVHGAPLGESGVS